MITNVLSKAYTTVKQNFWSLVAMFLPTLVFSAFSGWLVPMLTNFDSIVVQAMIGSVDLPSKLGGVFSLVLVLEIITFLLGTSFSFGLIIGLKDGKFRFKNAFAAFHGFTWLAVLGLYVVEVILLSLLVGFFAMVTIGFIVAAMKSWFFGILAFIVAVLGVVCLVYVGLGLQFLFFTYFMDKDDDDTNFFDAFVTNWKLIKGYRWQLIGFILMQFLIGLVLMVIAGLISGIIFAILAVMSNPGLRLVVAAILGLIAVVIFLGAYVFYGLWSAVANAQFFLDLRDRKATTSQPTAEESQD
ncbi:hypothetical protein [Fructilactobacillus cliffordii]|uniref:Glycerophosphoryl diester phosphodiesterase membrane domain-containing protein n=1 Tax=Fructilactobacillus cliffordii TaxID=2940299 RepID=A0A9Q9E064_9LACO|nr:hypothetical protein [Fructilactobacillus cliffordii]USS88881.1 hypothetical protein M3M40_05190 [Fructilactobacillus cliffordii]